MWQWSVGWVSFCCPFVGWLLHWKCGNAWKVKNSSDPACMHMFLCLKFEQRSWVIQEFRTIQSMENRERENPLVSIFFYTVSPLLLWLFLDTSFPLLPPGFFPFFRFFLAADLGSVITPLLWTLWNDNQMTIKLYFHYLQISHLIFLFVKQCLCSFTFCKQ